MNFHNECSSVNNWEDPLAASHCGQQTFDFIEEDQPSANVAAIRQHSFFNISQSEVTGQG
jgi:hypothetical protein